MSEGEKPARRKVAPKPAFPLGPVVVTGEIKPPETRKELETRLRIREANAEQARLEKVERLDLERWRERTVLKVGIAALTIIGVYCLVLNALPGQPPESKAWATSTLTGIVGGLVGYIVGTARK